MRLPRLEHSVALLQALLLLALPPTPLHPQAATPAKCDSVRWHRDCSTPGVQLALVEVFRNKARNDIVVGYHITASHVPAGKAFAVWAKPTGSEPFAVMTGFMADSTGTLTCGDSTVAASEVRRAAKLWCRGAIESVTLSAGQYALGEAYRVALISIDDSVRVYAEAIPHPLEASADGCTLTGEMHSREIFAFSGTGFRPGEVVQAMSRSGKEAMASSQTADDAGRLAWMIILPGVKGKRGGDASYEVTGAGCRVTLRYGWGNKVLSP